MALHGEHYQFCGAKALSSLADALGAVTTTARFSVKVKTNITQTDLALTSS